MVYKCENTECGFLFSRQSEVTLCPNCGKGNIRMATPEEEETFYKLLEEDKKRPVG